MGRTRRSKKNQELKVKESERICRVELPKNLMEQKAISGSLDHFPMADELSFCSLTLTGLREEIHLTCRIL